MYTAGSGDCTYVPPTLKDTSTQVHILPVSEEFRVEQTHGLQTRDAHEHGGPGHPCAPGRTARKLTRIGIFVFPIGPLDSSARMLLAAIRPQETRCRDNHSRFLVHETPQPRQAI